MRTGLAKAWWSHVSSFDQDGTRCRNEFFERMMAAKNLAHDWTCRENWPEAETVMKAWHAAVQEEVGDHFATLASLRDLGKMHQRRGERKKAEQLLREVLAAFKRILGEENAETLRSARRLAKTLVVQRKYDEAHALLLETFTTEFRRLGATHPDTLKSASWLAKTYAGKGNDKVAEKIHQSVFDLRLGTLGWEHRKTLASASELACWLSSQRRHAEAENKFRHVLDIKTRVLGEAHPETEDSVDLLEEVLSIQGKHAEAEQLVRWMLRVNGHVRGKKHPNTRARARDLALSLAEHQGRYEEAEAILMEVIRVNEELVEEGHTVNPVYTLGLKDYVGELLSAQGKHAEAERFYREVDPFRKGAWRPTRLLLRLFGEDATMLRDAAAEKSESEPKVRWKCNGLQLQIVLFESLKAGISSCASSGAAA